MHEVLRFEPLFQGRIWGGRRLETALGRSLPPDEPIGESWEIVDRPEAQSVIRAGALAGQTLRQALEAHSSAIMGPGWRSDRPFPLLVKWLDCRARLSLQVHPPAAIAPVLKGEPKTENWFVASAEPGAALLVGLRPGINRAKFEQALANETIESCVRRFPVAAGDSILVESGTVHAIDAGCLILEIQQNSDTTYRVYDWGRVGADGQTRKLHVQESLASILWSGEGAELVPAASVKAVLADAAEFRIRRVPLAAGETLEIAPDEQPRLLGIVSGGVETVGSPGGVLSSGENVLLPFAGRFSFKAVEPSLVLVTENFVFPGKFVHLRTEVIVVGFRNRQSGFQAVEFGRNRVECCRQAFQVEA